MTASSTDSTHNPQRVKFAHGLSQQGLIIRLEDGASGTRAVDSSDIGAAAARTRPDQRFGKALEASFRAYHRRRYRAPRAWLYLIFGIAFLVSPLNTGALFAASPEVVPVLQWVSMYVIAPLNLIAFATLLLNAPHVVSGVLQTTAAIASVSCALWLRHLDRTGSLHYPVHLLGVIIIALSVFGGYSWYRVVFGSVLFASADIYGSLATGPVEPPDIVDAYGLLLMTVIAVTAGYTLERLARLAWLFSRRASHLARTDVLTGLASRLEFNRAFPRLLMHAQRDRITVAVMLLDVDHFKKINDDNGHMVGDDALRLLGHALAALPKRNPLDLIVRFGGEELLFAWYDIDEDSALQRAEQILDLIRATPVPLVGGTAPLQMTASAGLTWLVPAEKTTPAAIVHVADELLYAAKSGGRNRIVSGSFAGTAA